MRYVMAQKSDEVRTRRIEGVNQDKAHLNEILRTPFDFCVPTIS